MIQTLDDMEKWHMTNDPWNYENNPEDIKRKNILLSEIPSKNYKKVLDIGCGQGFITRDLPGKQILGIDISHEAIKKAKVYESNRIKFLQSSLFDLNRNLKEEYDLIIISGVLYPQYIGNSLNLVYLIIDKLLMDSGILISVHIDEWDKKSCFPYLKLKEYYYDYREYTHKLEVYVK